MKLTALDKITPTTVSHNARISKQTLLGYAEFPPLTNFSQARFPPGEIAFAHQHADMLEVFFIQSGHAVMAVNGTDYPLTASSCIVIEAGESHELRNTSPDEELVVTYFGIQLSV